MIASALGAAWAGVVVAALYRRRPPSRRVRAVVARAAAGSARSTGCDSSRKSLHHSATSARNGGVAAMAGASTTAVGAWVLRRLGRPASLPMARRVGGAVLAAAVALPVAPLAAVPAFLVAWAVPAWRAGRAESRRRAALAAGLPDLVDLLVLAVGAGLTVHLAVASVARRGTGPLAAELARASEEASMGRRLADALDDIPGRAGEPIRPLVAALIASERYGAPLAAGLERLAGEVRRDRRRRAEEAARKVPVKLLFPLVACTLPAFVLLTVAPLIAGAVRSLPL